jgi:hypothetical protein
MTKQRDPIQLQTRNYSFHLLLLLLEDLPQLMKPGFILVAEPEKDNHFPSIIQNLGAVIPRNNKS